MGANRKRDIGSWPDTGLGGALKESYPAAYDRYKAICDEHNGPDGRPTDLLAGCCHVSMLSKPSGLGVGKLPSLLK